MDDIRKGQIAVLYLKYQIRKDGLRFKPAALRREAGNLAKAIGISIDEVMEFTEFMVRETVDEVFTEAGKRN